MKHNLLVVLLTLTFLLLVLTACSDEQPFPFNKVPDHYNIKPFHIPNEWDVVSIMYTSHRDNTDHPMVHISFGTSTGESMDVDVFNKGKSEIMTSVERQLIFGKQYEEVYATLSIEKFDSESHKFKELEEAFAELGGEGIAHTIIELPYSQVAYYEYKAEYLPELDHPVYYIWYSDDLRLRYNLTPNMSLTSGAYNVEDIDIPLEKMLDWINELTTPLNQSVME